MPDVHESVGYFTVTGNLNVPLLDSDDVGDVPDRKPGAGTYTITPWRDGVQMTSPIVVLADESVLVLEKYEGTIDSEGRMIAPADGQAGVGTSTNIRLIAPQQLAISESGWLWRFAFEPGAGQTWTAFSVWITGVPNEVRTVGRAVMEGSVSTLAHLIAAVVIYGDSIETVSAADVPPGTPDGALCVLLPIGYIPDPETPLGPVPTFIYRA